MSLVTDRIGMVFWVSSQRYSEGSVGGLAVQCWILHDATQPIKRNQTRHWTLLQYSFAIAADMVVCPQHKATMLARTE